MKLINPLTNTDCCLEKHYAAWCGVHHEPQRLEVGGNHKLLQNKRAQTFALWKSLFVILLWISELQLVLAFCQISIKGKRSFLGPNPPVCHPSKRSERDPY